MNIDFASRMDSFERDISEIEKVCPESARELQEGLERLRREYRSKFDQNASLVSGELFVPGEVFSKDYALSYKTSKKAIEVALQSIGCVEVVSVEASIVEILVDVTIANMAAGALINPDLVMLIVEEGYGRIERELDYSFSNVYPSRVKTRPVRIIYTKLSQALLYGLKIRLGVKSLRNLDYDAEQVKEALADRLASLGYKGKTLSSKLKRFCNSASTYWRFNLPSPLLEYYTKPYSSTSLTDVQFQRLVHCKHFHEAAVTFEELGSDLDIYISKNMEMEVGAATTIDIQGFVVMLEGAIDSAYSEPGTHADNLDRLESKTDYRSSQYVFRNLALNSMSRLLLGYVYDIATQGTPNRRRAKGKCPVESTVRAYTSVAIRLARRVGNEELGDLDPDSLETMVTSLLSKGNENETLKKELRYFCEYGAEKSPLPDVDSSIFGADDLNIPARSNIVTPVEQSISLKILLMSDLDEHNKILLGIHQILLNRYGLRPIEVWYLRYIDVYCLFGMKSVSVGLHAGFKAKSVDGNRNVLEGLMPSPEELSIIAKFSDLVRQMKVDQTSFIFKMSNAEENDKKCKEIRRMATTLMREVTGDSTSRLYDHRHSLVTAKFIDEMVVKRFEHNGNLSNRFVANVISDGSARCIEDYSDPFALEPLRYMAGHSSSRVTRRHYIHGMELWLYHEVIRHEFHVFSEQQLAVIFNNDRDARKGNKHLYTKAKWILIDKPPRKQQRWASSIRLKRAPTSLDLESLDSLLVSCSDHVYSRKAIAIRHDISEEHVKQIQSVVSELQTESGFRFYSASSIENDLEKVHSFGTDRVRFQFALRWLDSRFKSLPEESLHAFQENSKVWMPAYRSTRSRESFYFQSWTKLDEFLEFMGSIGMSHRSLMVLQPANAAPNELQKLILQSRERDLTISGGPVPVPNQLPANIHADRLFVSLIRNSSEPLQYPSQVLRLFLIASLWLHLRVNEFRFRSRKTS